ncbi:hypothetical protein U8335_23805 [Roseiconus lacunae]|uniref:hypothetical protein n=1 Tax=Roseiconus lacunae TaxID=2605694 RepID=UPI00308EECF1|nr:hypothetical protein U8335_23805 [Stieleria sp. HD01]
MPQEESSPAAEPYLLDINHRQSEVRVSKENVGYTSGSDRQQVATDKLSILNVRGATFSRIVFQCNQLSFSEPVTLSHCEVSAISLKFKCPTKLSTCKIDSATVDRFTWAKQCQFDDCTVILNETEFTEVLFDTARLGQGKVIRNARFVNCIFKNGKFQSQVIEDTSFADCEFDGVIFTSGTEFKDCSFKNCSMTRRTYSTLRKDSLTDADRMGIRIIDPIEVLRKNFSGFNSFIHWMLVAIFATPYLTFIGVQWMKHLTWPEEGTETLFFQLLKFICSGGETNELWRFNLLSMVLFLYYLIFNACRVALLWLMKQIETDERLQEVPSSFSLASHPIWRNVEKFVRYSFWVGVPVVIVNTIIFLSTKTPY